MSPPGASRRRSKKRPRHKFNAADQPRFIHTLVNQKIEDPALIAAVYREWKMTGEWWCHTIHEGRYYKCSIAPFSGARIARLGVDYQPDADSIGLHGNPSRPLGSRAVPPQA